jgi:hypothetical protein
MLSLAETLKIVSFPLQSYQQMTHAKHITKCQSADRRNRSIFKHRILFGFFFFNFDRKFHILVMCIFLMQKKYIIIIKPLKKCHRNIHNHLPVASEKLKTDGRCTLNSVIDANTIWY